MTQVAVSVPVPTSIGRRIGAYAIDIATQSLVVGVAGGVTAAIVLGGSPPSDASAVLAALGAIYGVVALAGLAWVVVYTLMQGGGGSLGQRLLRIRLADAETGASIGFGRALVRNLVWALGGAIVVGYFSPLFDGSPRHQGWHDRASRAFVGDTRSSEQAPPPDATDTAEAETAAPASPPVPIAAAPIGPPPRFTSAPASPSAGGSSGAVPPVTPYGLISHVPGVAPREALEPAASPEVSPYERAMPGLGADVEETALVRGPAEPTREPQAAPATEPPDTPTAPEPAAAEPTPAASLPADDATVAAAPRRRAIVAFTWDTGERVAVYGTTLFGRNPAAEAGAAVVAVRDETLSLSKTHFEIGADGDGAWILDRHSTNGSVLVRDGKRTPLTPGIRVPIHAGDRIEFGDRSLQIGDAP